MFQESNFTALSAAVKKVLGAAVAPFLRRAALPTPTRQNIRRASVLAEALEVRTHLTIVIPPALGVETFASDGAKRLVDPAIYLVFWGNYWHSDAPELTKENQVIADTKRADREQVYGGDGPVWNRRVGVLSCRLRMGA